MVRDLVVVRESKRKVKREIFWENGVEVNERRWDSKCDLRVVFPDPDSPLKYQISNVQQQKMSMAIERRPVRILA